MFGRERLGMKRAIGGLVLLASLVAASASALAQEVRLMVDGIPDAERLRRELSAELGRPAILGESGVPGIEGAQPCTSGQNP